MTKRPLLLTCGYSLAVSGVGFAPWLRAPGVIAVILASLAFLLVAAFIGLKEKNGLATASELTAIDARERSYISPYAVCCDDDGIRISLNGVGHASVSWADLLVVGIRIENQGFIDVPYWYVSGRHGSCMFPSDALGNEKIMDAFSRRLPGFHSKETYTIIAEAMTAVTGGFVAWERPNISAS